jgi:hypothetical protein
MQLIDNIKKSKDNAHPNIKLSIRKMCPIILLLGFKINCIDCINHLR